MPITCPLKVALFGYGYAGKTFHAPLLAACKDMELAAVVSSDSGKVRSDFPEMRVVAEAQPIMSDSSIDLVVIATPNKTHYDLASQALAAGKHVVVDKPFVLTAKQAGDLYEQAAKSGKIISVFQNRRWDADFLCVQGLLAKLELGELSHVEMHFDRFRPQVKARWREQDRDGGGLWFDLGSHLADQAIVLFGEPESVYATFARQRENAQAVDFFHAILCYGQMRVILHGSTLAAAQPARFALHGRHGSFIKYGLDTQEEALKAGQIPGTSDWGKDMSPGILFKPQDEAGTDIAEHVIEAPPGNYAAYFDAIAGAVCDGKPNPVTRAQAVAVMKILELGVASARTGQTIPWSAACSRAGT